MFAIPGLVGLLLFIYLRPQEIYESLSGVTFAMAASAVFVGVAIDWRLAASRPRLSPLLALGGLYASLYRQQMEIARHGPAAELGRVPQAESGQAVG